MRKLYVRTMFVVFALFVLFSPQTEVAAKVYLAYISDAPDSSVPFWVAKEAGLLKKHGVDMEMLFINGSTRGIQSLIAGDLAYTGAVGTAVINGRLAGGDVVIVSSFVNTLPYYIVGRPTIRSPEELKGKAAAVHIPGTSADFALRLALKGVGLSMRDIKAVTVGGSPARIAAVLGGQVDFTVVTESGKAAAEKSGMKLIIDMGKLNIPFQFSCTVTTAKRIRENPEEVRRVVRAMAEAVHYYKTRREDVIKIMQKYTRGQKREILEEAHSKYVDLLVDDTYPTLEGLKNTLEIQASLDPKAAKARAEDFVDLRFVEELKKSGFINQLYGRR